MKVGMAGGIYPAPEGMDEMGYPFFNGLVFRRVRRETGSNDRSKREIYQLRKGGEHETWSTNRDAEQGVGRRLGKAKIGILR